MCVCGACVCVLGVCGACLWCACVWRVCVVRMCGCVRVSACAYLSASIGKCMDECTCGQVRVFIYVDVYVCACICVSEISLVSSIF